MKTTFLTNQELIKLGFKSIGTNCLISSKASIYTPETISISDNVRIDDFCILSGEINIGSYVHISAYTALYAAFGIDINDFVTISGRVSLYSQNDDYSGAHMTNPMVPREYTQITGSRIILQKHSIIGAGSIVLPGVILHEGACIGAMSLVKNEIEPWSIYAGIPCKFISRRKNTAANFEKNIKLSEQ